MNAREQLEAAANWLGWSDESLSFGLKNAEDGLKLWRYSQAHPELDEFADTWEPEEVKKAIGYNPWLLNYEDGKPIAA